MFTVRGVDISGTSTYADRKLVLRSKKITHTLSVTDDREIGVPYKTRVRPAHNWLYGMSKHRDAWFCSELAAALLKDAGHTVVDQRTPERIWPGHFEHSRNDGSWMDVPIFIQAIPPFYARGRDEPQSDPIARAKYTLSVRPCFAFTHPTN